MLHEKEENLICGECGDEFAVQVCRDSVVSGYVHAYAKFGVHILSCVDGDIMHKKKCTRIVPHPKSAQPFSRNGQNGRPRLRF